MVFHGDSIPVRVCHQEALRRRPRLARLRAAGLLWTNTNYCLGRLEAAGHHREEPGAQWGTCHLISAYDE